MKNTINSLKRIVFFAVVLFSCTDINAQTILADEIQSSYDVTPTGAFVYSLPLSIPPGIKDMMPNIAISYNSQGGGGNLGVGWSISGLSAITRTSSTIYHNQLRDAVDFDSYDVFSLDGQRLFETGTGIYMTEIKNFAKIESHGISGNGPSYFTVEYPNGTTYEYGNSIHSKMLAQGRSDVYMWALNKVYDLNGNYIEFDYDNNQVDGIYKISSLTYGHNANVSTSLTTANSLEFYYTSRPDNNTSWVAGSIVQDNEILDRIEVKQNAVLTNTYQFTYEHRLQGGLLDYFTHLIRIDEIYPGGFQLPPVTINWGTVSQDDYTLAPLPQSFALADITSDFNGDGATDVIHLNGVANNAPFEVDINDKNGGFTHVSTGNVHYTIGNGPNTIKSMQASDRKGNLYFDYNGDGLDDMILIIVDLTAPANPQMVVEYYQSDGTNLNYESTVYTHTMTDSTWTDYCKVLPGDFDGDGKRELLITQPTGFVVNGSDKFATGYDLIIVGDNYPTNNGVPQTSNMAGACSGHNFSAFVTDYNGDGKDDFCRTTDGISAPFEIYNIDVTYSPSIALANAPNSMTLLLNRAFPDKNWAVYPGDFNGDGLGDLLTWKQTYGWEIFYSKANGDYGVYSLPVDVTNHLHPSGPFALQGNGAPNCYYVTGDFNGDGKDDIVELGNFTSSKYYNVFYSYGFNEFRYEYANLPVNFETGNDMHLGDFNGDGQLDIMGYDYTSTLTPAVIYFHPDDKEHVVTSIDHAGKRLEIELKKLSQATEDPNDADHYGYNAWSVNGHTPREYPYLSRQIPINVVTALRDNIALDNSYTYQTLSMHVTGLGMLGFEKVNITDNSAQKLTENHYSLFPFWGTQGQYSKQNFLFESTVYPIGSISPMSYTKMSYLDEPGNASGEVRIIKQYGIITTDYSVGLYHDSHTGFDVNSLLFYDFGVPDSVYDDKSIQNGYLNTITKYAYDTSLSFYNKSKPVSITETLTYPGKTPYARTNQFQYNAEGLVIQENEYPRTNHKTVFGYDVFGNAISSTLGVGANARIKYSDYSQDGRFLIRETRLNDGDNIIDEYEYNAWGKVTKHKSNLLETQYEYDILNRLIKTIHPDDVVTRKSYDWAYNNTHNPPSSFSSYEAITSNLNAAQFVVTSTTDGILGATYEFLDFYGRKLRNASTSYDGTIIYKDVNYYAMGGVSMNTLPYFNTAAPEYTSYSYDEFGRETDRSSTAGPSFTTEYFTSINPGYLKTTVTNNATGQEKITYSSAGGVYLINENGNSIQYNFNSNGHPDEIVVNGNQLLKTTYTYDHFGNVLTKTEPNAGTVTYTYNYLDQVVDETLTNGTKYTYTYDDFGNVLTKTDQYFNTYEYQYYNSVSPAVGKLFTEKLTTSTFVTTTNRYDYDAVARLTKLTESIDANHVLVTEYTYDAYSRVQTHKYPSGFIVTKNYNQYGFLESIDGPGQKLWGIGAKDNLNQIAFCSYYDQSNQVNYIGTRSYDALGYPTSRAIHTMNGGIGPSIAEYEYSFDPNTGNLTFRNDLIHNLREDFSYDAFDRLTDVTNTASLPALHVRFSPEGNIIEKNDISNSQYDWQYDQYALKTVPDGDISQPLPVMLADARQPNTQNIIYNYFNKVEEIKEAGNEVHFMYGPSDERVKMQFNPGVSGQKEVYYGLNYEEITENGITKKLSYIRGENELIAIISEVQGNTSIYYVGTDYLGSITELIDAQGGGIVEERSFDAWGRPRDPNTWQYYPASTPPAFGWITDRGYTGHEHVWGNGYDFNIINMNGRLYDPLTGRMFSPDPYVVDGTSTEAFNKYTYAANNPLKYTDPDGKFWHIIIGGIVGGVVNWATHGAKFNAKGLGYFAVGAVAGAVTAATGGLVTGAIGFGGVAGGAVVGASTGFTGGFLTGTGNSLVQGNSLTNSLNTGLRYGAMGAIGGAAVGGLIGGVSAAINRANLWNGKAIQHKLESEYYASTGKNGGNRYRLPKRYTLANGDNYDVAYRSENGVFGKLKPGYYTNTRMDGIATSKYTDMVFKIPDGSGSVYVDLGGEAIYKNGMGVIGNVLNPDRGIGTITALFPYGWKGIDYFEKYDYFTNRHSVIDWGKLFDMAKLLK